MGGGVSGLRVPRWYLMLGGGGVALIVAGLALALVSASASTRPYKTMMCYNGGRVLDTSEGYLGHALSKVNVTLVNRGECILRVEGVEVEPGGRLVLEPGARVRVEAPSGCTYCIETRGVEVVYEHAVLSIPALILSIAGFALVLYASLRLVEGGVNE